MDRRKFLQAVPARPEPRTIMAEWLMARLKDKPFTSERWLVEPSGHVQKTPV
jgi:hypothetical protein